MELGRWTESVWKEAFETRFLPSWERYKGEGDTWRAVFLRLVPNLNEGAVTDLQYLVSNIKSWKSAIQTASFIRSFRRAVRDSG